VETANVSFAKIIRSDQRVRRALADYPVARVWWRWILRLHGKPENVELSAEAQAVLIAKGFEAYAWLFRGLSIFFAIAAFVGYFLRDVLGPDLAQGTALGGVVLGALLWVASAMIFSGAKAYRNRVRSGSVILVMGLTIVVALLVAMLLGAGAIVQCLHLAPAWLNGVVVAALLTFGVGSYGLELTYLLVLLAHLY
jgi:hypothetical protein